MVLCELCGKEEEEGHTYTEETNKISAAFLFFFHLQEHGGRSSSPFTAEGLGSRPDYSLPLLPASPHHGQQESYSQPGRRGFDTGDP